MKPSVTFSIIAAAISFATSASAINVFWGNPGAGNWNVASNWVGGVVPGNDDARITNGGIAVIDSPQDIFTGFATMGDILGTTGTLQMTGGKLTTTSSDIRVGGNAAAAGGTGFFDQSGGTVTMNFGNLNVGFGTNAHGTYNLSGGSLLLNTAGATVVAAIGNRGVGIVNQTGGEMFLKVGNAFTQLGRNVAAGTGFGTYNLSGGAHTTPRLVFGDAVGIAGSANIFNLSGSGILRVGTIFVKNTAASNDFNFTGGTLLVSNIGGLSLRQSGGVLSPTFFDFGVAGATSTDSLPSNSIATLTFTNTQTSFVQEAGTYVVDIDSSGNDFISLPIATGPQSPSTVASFAGIIAVNCANHFNPSLGATFDIAAADFVTNSAAVTGTTPDGYGFAPSVVNLPNGSQVLRLTVVVPRPQLNAPVLLGNGSFKFTFRGPPGYVYNVLSTADITLPSGWTEEGQTDEAMPGHYEFIAPAPLSAKRFFTVYLP